MCPFLLFCLSHKLEQRAEEKGQVAVGARMEHVVKSTSPRGPRTRRNILTGVWAGKKRIPPPPEWVLSQCPVREILPGSSQVVVTRRGKKGPSWGQSTQFLFLPSGDRRRGECAVRVARVPTGPAWRSGADPHPPKAGTSLRSK